MTIPSRIEMYLYYFQDPKDKKYVKELCQTKLEYFYYSDPFKITLNNNEVGNICILKGSSNLIRNNNTFQLNQFDMIFIPKNETITIEPNSKNKFDNKICIVKAPILGDIGEKLGSSFEIKHFSFDNFIPRGELCDLQKMATYREVWTAFKNGYFMSGFTNIPQKALKQGVMTSVNLETNDNDVFKIYPHIHPEYPEIYIFCIDDTTESVAVTQFLINSNGQSVCKDLVDGDGIFFEGSMGHINFTKPIYKKLRYCLYMWIIPTFGKTKDVIPITLFTDKR
ncbi:MAG: hypothetical protein ACTSPY_12040 [Candidatus Helarchaeota archaeon]